MKKLIPLFILPILFSILCFPSCKKEAEETANAKYEIHAELNAEQNELNLTAIIEYRIPQEGLSAVKLRLFPNAYSEGNSIVSAEKERAAYPKGPSYGGADILSVSSNVGVKDYAVGVEDSTVMTVRFPEKQKRGKVIRLSIEENVRLATIKHRLGAYGGYYNLSGFYPSLCPFSGGKYREDAFTNYGDPFLFENSDFSVHLTLPTGYEAASSSLPYERDKQGTKTTFRYALENARDFAIVASNRLQKIETMIGEIPLLYYYESDKKSADILETARNAFQLFEREFGAYPYPSLTLVAAPFAEAGMEYTGLALLSNELSNAAKKHTVIHEIAHQWWFGKVGFDQYVSPWMDEGLAEYSTAFYYKATDRESAFRAMIADAQEDFSVYSAIKGASASRLDAPLPDLADGYHEIVYCKSLLCFSSLAEIEGFDRTNAALKSFAEEFKDKIATPQDLISALSKGLGKDLSAFFDAWLGTALPIE